MTQANPLETETPEASSPSDIQSERAVGESRPVLSPEFTAVPLAREVQLSPVLPPPGKIQFVMPISRGLWHPACYLSG